MTIGYPETDLVYGFNSAVPVVIRINTYMQVTYLQAAAPYTCAIHNTAQTGKAKFNRTVCSVHFLEYSITPTHTYEFSQYIIE